MRFRDLFSTSFIAVLLVGCSSEIENLKSTNTVTVRSTQSSETTTASSGQKTMDVDPSVSEADAMNEKEDSNDTTQETITGRYNPLDEEASYVILRKGTQPRSNDGYTLTKDPGTYVCRQCNAQLYRAEHKFESHCGWPSFDDEIDGAVERHPDADGYRVEIVCANCQGHLGHVFHGEGLTRKNTRHCVNSISMKFIPEGKELPAKIVASKESQAKQP
ncbi:MAG: methionine-R-sulfoxide reductase [Pirellulaceae bacterium]|nr:methionine-R-sulfoxide reductase [Pirellulaceae bacterium]